MISNYSLNAKILGIVYHEYWIKLYEEKSIYYLGQK
jgi:hypothetical protein